MSEITIIGASERKVADARVTGALRVPVSVIGRCIRP